MTRIQQHFRYGGRDGIEYILTTDFAISLALLRSLTSAYNWRFRVKPGMRKDGSERGRAGWDEMISALINTKTIWIVLALVFGALVFVLGCLVGADPVQYFGAVLLFVGLIGLFEKIWPEEVMR